MNRVKHIFAKMLLTFACLFNLFLLGTFVFQSGKFVQLTYLSNVYGAKLEKAEEENVSLKAQLMDKISLNNIEEKMKSLSFASSENVKYIPIGEMYVAGNLGLVNK
jgi:hypothetical protein